MNFVGLYHLNSLFVHGSDTIKCLNGISLGQSHTLVCIMLILFFLMDLTQSNILTEHLLTAWYTDNLVPRMCLSALLQHCKNKENTEIIFIKIL